MKSDEDQASPIAVKILAAIENEKYKSRTIKGIASETGIKHVDVVKVLNDSHFLMRKVMVVPGVEKNNQRLYVSVDRYKKETPISVRILNLIKK